MYSVTSGTENTSLGNSAAASMTTGASNAIIGERAGLSITTGSRNTYLGSFAGACVTTGGCNILIGREAATATTPLTTGSCNVLIGDSTNPGAAARVCSVIVGYGGVSKGDNTGFIASGGGVFQGNNSADWSTTSDQRIKKNITDNNIGLAKIKQIKVRNFEYKTKDEIIELPKDSFINKKGIQIGIIAQEMEEILPEMVETQSTGVKSVNTNNLNWYLVNAIKELAAKVEALENK
jgi:hypothetical protein